MFDPADIKPATVQEMVDALRFIDREFTRYKHVDDVAMRRVKRALAAVDRDQARALYAGLSNAADPHAATAGE